MPAKTSYTTFRTWSSPAAHRVSMTKVLSSWSAVAVPSIRRKLCEVSSRRRPLITRLSPRRSGRKGFQKLSPR